MTTASGGRPPPFDLVDLRLLIALGDHRHFARAADACNLSQPALSARIRKLETMLKTPLVLRGKRFEGFTPDGEKTLQWARRILAECEGLVQDVGPVGSGPHGALRLGVVPSATPLAGRLCGLLAKRHPGIRPQAQSLSSRRIAEGITGFSLEAGITYLGGELPSGQRALPLLEEQYCLVARPSLLEKGSKAVAWREAAALPLCLLTPDMQNRRIVDAAFGEAGAQPSIRFEANSFNAILALVRSHEFAAVLPRLQVEASRLDDLIVRDLEAPVNRPQIGLIMPVRDPDLPVASALWDLVSDPDLEL